MNRWTAMAFAALLTGLGGVWVKLRAFEPGNTLVAAAETQPALLLAAAPTPPEARSTDARPARPDGPSAVDVSAARERETVPQVSNIYDDAHLYQLPSAFERLPPTAQGVLLAFARSRQKTSGCLDAARRINPALTSLLTLEVRIASQEDGSAAVEELRFPTFNDPATAFRGCLVSALVDQRFDIPPGGFIRLSLPVDLSEPSP